MVMKGPLARRVPGMAERRTMLDYQPRLVERHLHLADGVSKFLQQRGMPANEFSPDVIEQFVGALRAKNRV